ncbi:MAG: DNA repair protein RadB [Patescibacteria group bacterium]|jgi:DNA repair protein RadB
MEQLRISTGNRDFDKFLSGGYEHDIITTLYGPGGSGKSNLCMCAAVTAVRNEGRVIFIDTEGGFSVERFFQIYGSSGADAKEALGRIFLLSPTTFTEQEEAFTDMVKWVNNRDINLIVVDSIVMLYRLEMGEASGSDDSSAIGEINNQLAKQLRSLNEIARKQHIPVLVTNQVYAKFSRDDTEQGGSNIHMVGGDLLKYWTKCLIELQAGGGRRKLLLRKHRSLPLQEFSFDIVESGIRKKGLF